MSRIIKRNTTLALLRLPTQYRDKLVQSTELDRQKSLAGEMDLILWKFHNNEFELTEQEIPLNDKGFDLSFRVDKEMNEEIKILAEQNDNFINDQYCVILNNYFKARLDTQV